ncbi:MAG: acetylxylan esterase [Anaerolineae bacterium]|nr:acetylxylan esterase [Anaerolineae bacterium]
MAFFDMPLDELERYRPARSEPADFDAFWTRNLEAARAHPLNIRFEPYDAGLNTVEVFDVTFAGYAGQAIKGWLLLPRHREGPVPGVVQYIGYGGGRGFPTDWLVWSSAGYAHLVMDTRGQGSVWRRGDTPDIIVEGANPAHPGFMTQGILSPETYYYKRLIVDAVRATEAIRTHEAVDSSRVALTGHSQGGGLSLIVAGLVPDVIATMPDVAFLCHYRRAAQITDAEPYSELAVYCHTHRDRIEQIFQTLSYFDGLNFAARAKAPALFSIGLMDQICPPSTVFAAYNHYQGPKQARVWEFNGHEGGEGYQHAAQIAFMRELLG